MSKPKPRFYTTKIPSGQTVTEIGDLLRRYGCRRFALEWNDAGEPSAIFFTVKIPHLDKEVDYKMAAQADGISHRCSGLSHKHALDIAWRQLLTWIELSLEIVENGVRPFHEVFAADMIDPDTGVRVGEVMHHALLASGE